MICQLFDLFLRQLLYHKIGHSSFPGHVLAVNCPIRTNFSSSLVACVLLTFSMCLAYTMALSLSWQCLRWLLCSRAVKWRSYCVRDFCWCNKPRYITLLETNFLKHKQRWVALKLPNGKV